MSDSYIEIWGEKEDEIGYGEEIASRWSDSEPIVEDKTPWEREEYTLHVRGVYGSPGIQGDMASNNGAEQVSRMGRENLAEFINSIPPDLLKGIMIQLAIKGDYKYDATFSDIINLVKAYYE
jgi:hypothetical protein